MFSFPYTPSKDRDFGASVQCSNYGRGRSEERSDDEGRMWDGLKGMGKIGIGVCCKRAFACESV